MFCGDIYHKCFIGFLYNMITGGAEHLSYEALKLQITWARQVGIIWASLDFDPRPTEAMSGQSNGLIMEHRT